MDNSDPPAGRHVDGPTRRLNSPESLEPAVQVEPPAQSVPTFTYAKKSNAQPLWRRWFYLSLVLAGLGLLLLAAKTLLATHKVITRNHSGGAPALAGVQDGYSREGDGRINILLLGIGGPGHQGADLTDTIMVASIDPKYQDVVLLSLPRDLYVPVPGYGTTKINSAHALGESRRGEGPSLTKTTVSKILDVPIHYFARLDFTGFKQGVDAVAGIDLTVGKAISDPYYPNDKIKGAYQPFAISAGPKHMDGELALKYARSRFTTSDFDRSLRQQAVLQAFRERVLSLGTLANPTKISSLIDLVGNHAKTDLQLTEIARLATIAREIDPAKVTTKSLDLSSDGFLANTNAYGGYGLVPKSGNFGDIQSFVRGLLVDNYIIEEAAKIEVDSGGSSRQTMDRVAKLLKSYNYRVVSTKETNNQATAIYDYSGGRKSHTVRYLENRFKVRAKKSNQSGEAVIKIVIGPNFQLP